LFTNTQDPKAQESVPLAQNIQHLDICETDIFNIFVCKRGTFQGLNELKDK
jgi:hypothetical protein